MPDWGKDFDEMALEWKAVIPAEPGWFAVELFPLDAEDTDFPGYYMERVIAWAQVDIVTHHDEKTENGAMEEVEHFWTALWGIISRSGPNYEPPPSLADKDTFYVHETEITDKLRATWHEQAERKSKR